MAYTNNQKLEDMISIAVASIEAGSPHSSLTAMVKNAPTYILLASVNHTEARYQPKHQLVTYNSVDKDGTPIQETWGGGVAEIKTDSVILKNTEPLRYPKCHELEGKEVKGVYQEDGKFVVDQKGGTTTLYNEYVSDVEFVKCAYGVLATEQLQTGLKLQSSYVMQIPQGIGEVVITTKSGVEINLSSGDYVIIDAPKDKVKSVHGCENSWLDRTYVSLESYLSTLKH